MFTFTVLFFGAIDKVIIGIGSSLLIKQDSLN